jgi:hypothetical protein
MIVINNEDVIHGSNLSLGEKAVYQEMTRTFRQHRPSQCAPVWIDRIRSPQQLLAGVLLSEPAPHHSAQKDIVDVHPVFSYAALRNVNRPLALCCTHAFHFSECNPTAKGSPRKQTRDHELSDGGVEISTPV